MVDLGGVRHYVVGDPESKRAIVYIYDIFGMDGSRTRPISDYLAEQGYVVVVPDIFEGSDFTEHGGFASPGKFSDEGHAWLQTQNWAKISRILDNIYAYLEGLGISCIGMIGFCWGTWAAFRAAEVPRLRCVVGPHPSLANGWKLYGEGPEETLCAAVTCPVLLMPAGNDPAAVKPGGAQFAVLQALPFGDKCRSIEFPEMIHGWVCRGDVSKPEVARDAASALDFTVKFFNEHMTL